MNVVGVAGLVCATALVTAATVPLVRRLALAWGAIDVPGGRGVTVKSTARLGGLAIFLGTALVLSVAGLFGWVPFTRSSFAVAPFVIGALLVIGVGVVDDFHRLRPHVKLVVEIVAALIVVTVGGCRIVGVSSPGGVIDLGGLGAPITVAWIVLVTNAFNLIDGIDGLAAGTAVIALVVVGVVAHGFGFPTVATFAVAILGACLGFLAFNLHPASIYLGDTGSLFLGFSVGVLSTYARAKGTTGAITLGTLLIVALPLGDTLLAIRRRYFQGLALGSPRSHLAGMRRIFQADGQHIHHRLLNMGLGQRRVVWALYTVQAIACAIAVYRFVNQ